MDKLDIFPKEGINWLLKSRILADDMGLKQTIAL